MFILITLALLSCVDDDYIPENIDTKKCATPLKGIKLYLDFFKFVFFILILSYLTANKVNVATPGLPKAKCQAPNVPATPAAPIPLAKVQLKISQGKKKVPPPPIVAKQTSSSTSLHSGRSNQSKKVLSKASLSKTLKGSKMPLAIPQIPSEAKSITKKSDVFKSTTSFKEEPKAKPKTADKLPKRKLPVFPEELGPVLVDQKLYDKLKKKYDMNTSTLSAKQSNIWADTPNGSDGTSRLSHFKTQSFGVSLSKCSTMMSKMDKQSTNDGVGPKKEPKEMKTVNTQKK